MENVANNVLYGQNDRRNYGIDLLRIVSMLLICLWHTLGHGGVFSAIEPMSAGYYSALFLESIAIFAVNCYALISGFVGVKATYKFTNIIYLWLQVVFYSLIITLIFFIFKPEAVSIKHLFFSIIPVTVTRYWYFTAYFGLFLFMPLLNYVIINAPKNVLKWSLLAIIIGFTVLTRVSDTLFGLNAGYSVLWLIVLYLVGGYYVKYKPLGKLKTGTLVWFLFFAVVVTWLSEPLIRVVTVWLFGTPRFVWIFTRYTSPTVFIASVIMLELFSRITFKKKPSTIAFLASLTFGVYLIHDNIVIRNNVISGWFASYATLNPILMVLCVLGTALCIYIVCSAIDALRLLLFKLLKIKPGLQKLETKIKNKLVKE